MKPPPFQIYRQNIIGPSASQSIMQVLLILLSACTLLYFGREIIIPAVLAILLAVLLAPFVRFLHRHWIPKGVAVLLAVFTAFALIFSLAFVVGRTLTDLAADLPRYETNLRTKAQSLKIATSSGKTLDQAADVLKRLESELVKPAEGTVAAPRPQAPIPVEIYDRNLGPLQPIAVVVETVAHPLTQFGIVILMLTFILFNREDLRNRLIRLAGTGDIHRTTVALDEAGHRLSRLFITQLCLNGATGAFIGGALYVMGVPGALLWGVLTAVLRFVPYIGTVLASVFPIVIALAVSDGWMLPLAVAGMILVTEFIVGHVIEPLAFGKMTGLSPVAVVVAAAFWTAVWGPIGLLLSIPLTVGLLVLGRHIESLNFLEVLLGSESVLPPEQMFYQRMLALDPIEAAEQAHDYEKEGKLEGFLAEVAVPGLLLAHYDQQRGVLTKEQGTHIARAFSDMLDEAWPDQPEASADASLAIVPAPGPLNFAAALAVSALLQLRSVHHVMLPQESLAAGKELEAPEAVETLIICYLVSPTPAQQAYVTRRAKSWAREVKLMSTAWSSPEGREQLQLPQNLAGILPTSPETGSAEKENEPLSPTAPVQKAPVRPLHPVQSKLLPG